MTLPAVTLNEQDGQLGILPPGTRALALFGPAASGTIGQVAAYARTTDVIAAYTAGRMVHEACYTIENYGLPVILCRTGETTVATEATIDVTGVLGTSVVTYDADTTANDDYDLYFKVSAGGTIGVAGITFQASTDGGRTLGPVTALGTATGYIFPGTGGVGFAFAAGTLLAGAVVQGRTFGPKPNGAEIGTALTALKDSAIKWDLLCASFDIDAALFDAVETGFGSGKGRKRMWIGGVRCPTTGETEAAYLTAQNTAFSAKATTRGTLCAGAAEITSGADFRKYRRGIAGAVAARAASVSEEVNIAMVDLGSLPGVSIRDTNGNPKHHDEAVNPGLDDARFTVLRTYDEEQGVYINKARIFSAAGSDFDIMPNRRVMNLVRVVLDAFFTRRLHKPIFVSRKTGRILESSAVEIETAASAAVGAVLDAKPKASGPALDGGKLYVKVSRTDNLLSTKTLTGQCGIVPLSYPEAIIFEIGFRNPSTQIIAV